jgi:plastocyanin
MTAVRSIVLYGIFAACAACGGGGDGPTGNVGPPEAVRVQGSRSALNPGESVQLTATAIDRNGRTVAGAGTPTWQSGAASVATVTNAGLVTAVSAGVTTVSATIAGIQGNMLITVVAPGTAAIVTMPGNTFSPFSVTINRGQQVLFDFPSVAHNVIFTQRTGVPGNIAETSNALVARTFNTAGQFPYECRLHPGMEGVVNVNQ